MATFVLLHGAWHGGWCWAEVARRLRAAGHEVTTPTQTGLGERRHLLSPALTLETFGRDLTEHLAFEDLTGAILVGHSFAGAALSIAAERAPARLRGLVYLDAMLLRGGESPFAQVPADVAEARREAARLNDGGVSIPPPPPESFGVTDPAAAARLAARLTPHPLGVYESALPLAGEPAAGFDPLYIRCTAPEYRPLDRSWVRARACGWRTAELAAGHDAMLTAPDAVADLLEAEAAR